MRRNNGKAPPRYRHKVEENKSLWYRWNGIKKRCLFENDERYDEYGGRGIRMCQEWQDSFDNFADWALANGFREDLTIERIDVNGDYCPENCCWIPLKEQAFNKRDTIWVDYHGRHVQLRKLCIEKGLNYDAIHNRIRNCGWDAEKAIDEPIRTNEDSFEKKCKKLGLNRAVVRDRINKLHWTEEEAFGTPTGRGRGIQHYKAREIKGYCARCGAEFSKNVGGQKYCSAECREADKKDRRRAANTKPAFSEGL